MLSPFQKKISTGLLFLSILFISSCGPDKKGPDVEEKIEIEGSGSYSRVSYPLLEPDQINIDSLFVQVAYDLGNDRALIIGRSQNEEDIEGLKMLLVERSRSRGARRRSAGRSAARC